MTAARAGDVSWQVVAACRANERARELDVTRDRRHGVLTSALLRELEGRTRAQLEALCWDELWPQLLSEVDRRSSAQHPLIVGEHERRVFGGPWEPRDPGYGLKPLDGEWFLVRAGSMVGVTAGAQLAVYSATVARIPPAGTPEEQALRLGVLEVESAQAGEASARLMAPAAAQPIPPDARARVIAPGKADQLRVHVEGLSPELTAQLTAPPLFAQSDPSGSQHELSVVPAHSGGGWYVLCDDMHGDADRGEPELARVRVAHDHVSDLREALDHYVHYAAPLRIARRCGNVRGSLVVEPLRCPQEDGPFSFQPTDTALTKFAQARSWYEMADGDRFCVRVRNESDYNLDVFVLNSAASGCVEFLGQETVAVGEAKLFWHPIQNGGRGVPFTASKEWAESPRLDRYIVVGTTDRSADLRALALDEPRWFELEEQRRHGGHGSNPAANLRGSFGDRKKAPAGLWTATTFAAVVR